LGAYGSKVEFSRGGATTQRENTNAAPLRRRVRNLPVSLVFLLCALILPVPAYSQALEKSVARKFDEFTSPFKDHYEEDTRQSRIA
jgi:hypothetical protein